ncbi:MAG: DUF4364 family protein [Acutalibacteraceae bacterium]|nr:DUF4364 family protein [Acutalibacteraceae bacterium]
MTNETFRSGVEPGGLSTYDEIKILICVLLDCSDIPLSSDSICNIIQSEALANYFDIKQAVARLESEGNIKIDDQGCYILTESGRFVAKELNTQLPYTVRRNALRRAKSVIMKKRNLKDNSVDITSVEGGYNVAITMNEGGKMIMSLTIRVHSLDDAECVKENFLENPSAIYSNSINILYGLDRKSDDEEE